MPELTTILPGLLSASTTFSTALRFDLTSRIYAQHTVTGALTFSVAAGTNLIGSTVTVRLVADGANIPSLSAFKRTANSADYDNRAGVLNVLNFWYDGSDFWVSIFQQADAIVLPPPDTTPPILQSIAVDSANFAKINITYNEVLLSSALPPTSSFIAVNNTISSVTIAGAVLSVTLGTALAAGASTTLTYTAGANPVRDASGNSAPNFSLSVTRPGGGGDTTPPSLVSAALDSGDFSRILLTYNESLSTSSIPAASAFALTGKTISSVSISGVTVTLQLSTVFPEGDTGTLTYTVPGSNRIQDASGNAAIAFSQTISRGLPARTWDFRDAGATSLPAGFSEVGLSSAVASANGRVITAPTTDWGAGLLIGPTVNFDRTLSIFLKSPSTTTKQYGGGISPTPQNWLNRGTLPDTLIAIKGSVYFNASNVKSYTAVAANTRLRIDFTKEGADVRVRIFRFDGTNFVLATNGDHLQVGVAAALSNSKIFVDAYQNEITVEMITN